MNVGTSGNAASLHVPFRLSEAQRRLVALGLIHLRLAYGVRQKTGVSPYAYPLQLYPLLPDVDRGQYDQEMMELTLATGKKIDSAKARSARFKMTHTEIRVLILGVRLNLDHSRFLSRQRKNAAHREWAIERGRFAELRKQCARLIATLERLLKRATRRAGAHGGSLAESSARWKNHLRWMRLYLVNFRPWPQITTGTKRRQMALIDRLVALSERGLRSRGYQSPDAATLRELVRLKLQYIRRGLPRHWINLRTAADTEIQFHLEEFILDRLEIPLRRPASGRKIGS